MSRNTVEGYVSILEDMLPGARLQVFSKREKRRLVKRSQFYYFDAGVFRSVRPSRPLDSPHEIYGLALEGLVYQHLRAWCDYAGEHNSGSLPREATGSHCMSEQSISSELLVI